MKNYILAFVTVLALGTASFTVARTGTQTYPKPTPTQNSKAMASCKKMMEEMDTMKSRCKDMDARLDRLVLNFDSSVSEDKPAAMAIVVKEMISQERSMRDMKAKMDAKMMVHMMEHMKSGKMTDCQMMKTMSMPMKSGY